MIVRTASHHFQQLDLASLQGATIGSRNRKRFYVQRCQLGLQNHYFKNWMVFKEMTPSQAEMMYSYCKSDSAVSDRVHYVKSKYCHNKTFRWLEVFILPKRWASKTTSYQSAFGQVLGLVVFLLNLSIVVGYGLWIMGLLSLLTICLLILLKFAIDAVLIHKSHSFWRQLKCSI
jgi:hypothetical protein